MCIPELHIIFCTKLKLRKANSSFDELGRTSVGSPPDRRGIGGKEFLP